MTMLILLQVIKEDIALYSLADWKYITDITNFSLFAIFGDAVPINVSVVSGCPFTISTSGFWNLTGNISGCPL